MAKKGKAKYVTTPVLILDTNALHYARVYLEFARKKKVYPFQTTKSPSDPSPIIGNAFGSRSKTYGSCLKGLKLVKYMRVKIKSERARLDYCPISRLELNHGLLKGEGIKSAASEGIPSRMWSAVDEHEITHRLMDKGFSKVGRNLTRLENIFKKTGIPIQKVDPKLLSDVWDMANDLYGLVYLDIGDCIIYASALISEADEILTSDGYLRRIVDDIKNPGAVKDQNERGYFKKVRMGIVKLVSNYVAIPHSKVRLPLATRPCDWQKAPLV